MEPSISKRSSSSSSGNPQQQSNMDDNNNALHQQKRKQANESELDILAVQRGGNLQPIQFIPFRNLQYTLIFLVSFLGILYLLLVRWDEELITTCKRSPYQRIQNPDNLNTAILGTYGTFFYLISCIPMDLLCWNKKVLKRIL